ncbi:MAG: peptidoglycan bridge formation glycyltransferase FemA/FemB family protein [Pirellulales bacterium]
MPDFVVQLDRESAIRATAASSLASAPEIIISEAAVDRDWDAFLAQTPGGHHVQTSMWSRLKATIGWKVVRLVAKEGGRIVGGVQVLMRRYGKGLEIGYAPKGPIFSAASEQTMAAFVAALRHQVRAHKLQCLIVQPPNETPLITVLRESEFRPVRMATFLRATTLVNLKPSVDDILRAMKESTRHSVRKSQRRGVQVRRGGGEDLDIFYELLMATAARQGFRDYSKSYFQELWRLFAPNGHAQLFVAEATGKPVAVLLKISFGDTVVSKKRGWSGELGRQRPNEAADWAAIQWAKEAGYHYYDFEGVPLGLAQSVLRGESLSDSGRRIPSSYKLGYGGEIRIFPEPLAFFSNPMIRWGHRWLYPTIAGWPIVDRLANRIKVN